MSALCRRVGLEVLHFSTVRVYRRIRSALTALDQFHGRSWSGRAARVLLQAVSGSLLDLDLPLNLGDTLCLVARKPAVTSPE